MSSLDWIDSRVPTIGSTGNQFKKGTSGHKFLWTLLDYSKTTFNLTAEIIIKSYICDVSNNKASTVKQIHNCTYQHNTYSDGYYRTWTMLMMSMIILVWHGQVRIIILLYDSNTILTFLMRTMTILYYNNKYLPGDSLTYWTLITLLLIVYFNKL